MRATRTILLIASVAISSAIAFTGATMMRGIERSMTVGFSRLGADLLVVPEGTLTNITTALLTVEPTDAVLDASLLDRAAIAGIERVAPQIAVRTDQSGFGAPGEAVDLIGFDPDHDLTVQPWIAERLGRAMGARDVIVGAARDLVPGADIELFGTPFRVYAKLGRTGIGTHERGIFMTEAALRALAPSIRARTGTVPASLDPGHVSGFLIQVGSGASQLQARFALLANLSGIKVIEGQSLLMGIRQGLMALLGGTMVLVAMMFASTAIMVAVLFSAIVGERRHELGLLKAIGAGRGQIVGTMLIEAMIATGAGGVIGVIVGVLILRLFARSLVFHLTRIGIPFLWPGPGATIVLAATCVLGATLVGVAGALAPAWRASRRDAYDLIHGGA